MGDQSSGFNLLSDEGDLIIEDLNSNPEDNSCHFMAILVESLSLLGKIPEALEEIKQRMKKEMSLIIHRATAQVKENAKQRDEPVSQQNQPHLLLELLQVLFDKFKSVANAHNIVLTSLSRVRRNTHNDNDSDDSYELYAMEEVWSEIQFAIQIILSDYLDVANTQSSQHQLSVGFTESESEIGKYFAMRKRGSSRSTKNPLFRFEGSSSAISLNTYIREQRQEFTSPHGTMNDPYADPMYNTKPELLCKPDAKNITVVFCPVVMFAEEIEESVQTQAGMRCQLYGYIMDYVKEIFLGHIQFNCNEKLELLTKGPDAFKGLADANTLKNLGATRPLLQSTVSIDQVVQGLKALMHNLPLYSSQFLDMICKTLAGYKEICYSAYRDIVKSKEGVTHIISATWAKDEDISRLLRSLPNWLNLTLQSQKKKEDDDDLEGIRLRNRRESELLTGNLQEHVIRDHEVIQDLTDLKMLSNLQETMEWLAGRIRQLATSLAGQSMAITVSCESHERMPKMSVLSNGDIAYLGARYTRKSTGLLDSLAQEFQNLAESCLLVLHLEIRCHCFYFLLPIIRNSSYVCNMESVDQDPNVIKLNKDLASLEEITAASLQPHKFRYLFEGLGDLISSILILGVVYIKKINPNGIKKMCRNIFALQQNLTNITMSREGDLDNARAYYELLYSNPEAILTQIIEQGPSFTEVQYANMLNLQSRSQTLVDQQALQRLKKLKELKVNSIKPSQPKQ